MTTGNWIVLFGAPILSVLSVAIRERYKLRTREVEIDAAQATEERVDTGKILTAKFGDDKEIRKLLLDMLESQRLATANETRRAVKAEASDLECRQANALMRGELQVLKSEIIQIKEGLGLASKPSILPPPIDDTIVPDPGP